MTALAQYMEWLFIAAWCVGVAAHIYTGRYFFPMWASGFKNKPKHKGTVAKRSSATVFSSALCWSDLLPGVSANWQAGGAEQTSAIAQLQTPQTTSIVLGCGG